MRKVLVRFALVLAVGLGLTVTGGTAGPSKAEAAGCSNVIATKYIYFNDISTTQPVASLKLLGDGGGCYQSYLYMWSWFTQSHSGWTVALDICTSVTPVWPVDTAGSPPSPCATPSKWYNTRQQEFYGPSAYGCGEAVVSIRYNSDYQLANTTEWCGT